MLLINPPKPPTPPHPYTNKARQMNSRASRKQAPGRVNGALLARYYQIYPAKCLRCGSVEGVVIDHIQPLRMGGRNDLPNLQPLCDGCNNAKGPGTIDFRTPRQKYQARFWQVYFSTKKRVRPVKRAVFGRIHRLLAATRLEAGK